MGCTLARRHKSTRNVAPSLTLHDMEGVGVGWHCTRNQERALWKVEVALASASYDPSDPVILWVLTVGKDSV